MLCSACPPSSPPAPVSRGAGRWGCSLMEGREAEACDSCARLPGSGTLLPRVSGAQRLHPSSRLHTLALTIPCAPNCRRCCPGTCSPVAPALALLTVLWARLSRVRARRRPSAFLFHTRCAWNYWGLEGTWSPWWVCSKHGLPRKLSSPRRQAMHSGPRFQGLGLVAWPAG